jgi:hypothetical protein
LPNSILFVLSIQALIRADSIGPYRNFRQVDPTGRYYVVVKKDESRKTASAFMPVTFEVAERKAGSPTVLSAADKGALEIVANPEVKVREGDVLLSRGKLDDHPAQIIVSSSGLGFVALNMVAHHGGRPSVGDALVVVSNDGTIRHHKKLSDLFDEREISQFVHTTSLIDWYTGAWIDENRKEVVLVGGQQWPGMTSLPTILRVVELESGRVREGSSTAILAALSDPNVPELDLVLELAAEKRLAQAKPQLERILVDDERPLAVRLRAAVALASIGDRRGKDLMKNAVLSSGSTWDDTCYAIQNLAFVTSDETASILCDVVRRFSTSRGCLARDAMRKLNGDAALASLRRLLEERRNLACTEFAAACLGDKGSAAKAAVPDLIKLLDGEPEQNDPPRIQKVAAKALGQIGRDAGAALPRLRRLAQRYAPEEWKKLETMLPALRKGPVGEAVCSDDDFVDAVFKIQRPSTGR